MLRGHVSRCLNPSKPPTHTTQPYSPTNEFLKNVTNTQNKLKCIYK